ncbi:ETX/MTX2 family pore-forming toxin [Bacillus paramycoides]|uniref:ETX/MTX2 family pore-forming toxin n=1 Tax=Bacillus paramycoides TaxID=2026194 RepID=UPI003D00BD17
MKKYKKAVLIAPLACVLGTGLFTLPNGAQAAEVQPKAAAYIDMYGEGTVATQDNIVKTLKNRLLRTIEKTPELRKKFNMTDDEIFQRENGGSTFTDPSGKTTTYPAIEYGYKSQLEKIELVLSGTSFSVDPSAITLEDDGLVNVLSYRNSSPEKQQLTTPEVTKKYSRTFSTTNQFGMKLGFEASTKVQVGIPVVNGEFSLKTSAEYSMGLTIGQSTTQEETLTYKSQTVTAAPNGITDYFYRVKKAKFSGKYRADAYLKDGLTLTIPVYKQQGDGTYNTPRRETATLTAADLYTIYKTSGIPLPPYIKLDDQSKKVLVNTEFSYEGEGGFYTQAQVTFTPIINTYSDTMPGSFNPSKTMPYQEYEKAIQNKSL